jgi:hypothetical protein
MHECNRGRVGLLHNLKRALLLEESTIVKKIRRFEDSKTRRLLASPVAQSCIPRPAKWESGQREMYGPRRVQKGNEGNSA